MRDVWVVKLSPLTATLPTIQQQLWQISPNPSGGAFKLQTDASFLGKNYQVFNAKGAEVCRGEIRTLEESISLEGRPSGIYSIRIAGQSGMLRLVKD